MCGIVGWFNLNSNCQANTSDEEPLLRTMCGKIRHRGPDAEGIFIDYPVALGMRRLAVIDLHTGEQPVFNEDKSIAVILNGEIYNFRELRRELEERGHQFRGNSDTEVLPHLYEEYGEKFVGKLNGMFSFALWDARRKIFLAARDRFGVKPFYYGTFDGKLFFASELKALTTHPQIDTKLDIFALRQFLSFDYVPAPLSIYQNIFKLPAAHLLKIENGQVSINCYWDLNFQKQSDSPNIAEAAAELREILEDATKIRMVSDVPLGVFLSGGLDSSSIAALAQKCSGKPIKTFCISFTENSFDESKQARQVAEYLGTEHYEDRLSVERAVELLPEIAGWLDEPFADASILPTFLLARFARSQVTVALGGDGSDEMFGGYPWYFAHKIAEKYEKIPKFLRRHFFERILYRMPTTLGNMPFDFVAKNFLKAVENKDVVARHQSFLGSFTMAEQNDLLSKDIALQSNADIYGEARRLVKNWDSANIIDLNAPDSDNVVERMQFLDMKFYLGENILTKVDRASMAVSLEVRSPFIDTRIAEFAAGLPRNFKLKCDSVKFGFGNTGKYILKKAVAPLLPDAIINRRKQGFVIPVAAWLKGKLNPLLREMLAPERIIKQGIFNSTYIQKLLKAHETGKANHSKMLWTLLIFQLWLENFPS